MAAKRKRKRAKRRANPTKKRATHRRKKRRANPSNPRRRRRSHARRAPAHRRRRARRAHARRANPSHGRRRRTHHRRRAHRRNPGGPLAQAAIALAVAAGAFVLTDVVTFYATSDMAKDGERNRKILGGLAVAGGLYYAVKRPGSLLGLAIAAGGALSGFGNMVMLQVLKLLPPKASGQTALGPSSVKGLGAVAYDNMAAVYADNMAALRLEAGNPMGAVAYDNMAGWEAMGDPVPGPPWSSDNPFGDDAGYPT